MRNISPDTFTDEIVARDCKTLIVWIGLITAIADDQGRLIDNPALIRAMLLPYDESTTTSAIEKVLQFFSDKHKITRYVAGSNGSGRKLIQINSWWKYQRSSQWAAASSYPAPEKWIDRVRMHVPGGQIQTINWDTDGGYLAATKPLRSGNGTKPLHSGKKAAKVSLEDEVNVKDEVKGKVKGDKNHHPTLLRKNKSRAQAGKAGSSSSSSTSTKTSTDQSITQLKTRDQWKRHDLAMKVLKSSGLRSPKLREVSVIVATRIYKNSKDFIAYLLGALASAYADPTATNKAMIAAHRIEEDTVPAEFKDQSTWQSIPADVLKAANVTIQQSNGKPSYSMDGWE